MSRYGLYCGVLPQVGFLVVEFRVWGFGLFLFRGLGFILVNVSSGLISGYDS